MGGIRFNFQIRISLLNFLFKRASSLYFNSYVDVTEEEKVSKDFSCILHHQYCCFMNRCVEQDSLVFADNFVPWGWPLAYREMVF